MNQLAQQSERFRQLLDEIRTETMALKREVRELKRENAKLKTKLETEQENQTDILSAITETERLAFRQQVKGLISKIEAHIDTDL